MFPGNNKNIVVDPLLSTVQCYNYYIPFAIVMNYTVYKYVGEMSIVGFLTFYSGILTITHNKEEQKKKKKKHKRKCSPNLTPF